MNDLYGHFILLLLVLIRISSMVITMPFFNTQSVPAQIKIGFSVVLSWIVVLTIYTPTLGSQLVSFTLDDLILACVREVLVGLCIGFLASFSFTAVQFAGQFIDLQSGMSSVTLFDPQNGQSLTLMSNFKNMLITLLFLLENGHHALIQAMLQSFQFIPVTHVFVMDTNLLNLIVQSFTVLFLLALKISIPVIGALFLVDVSLAIISRAVPQMNVFVIGLPIKILLSFLFVLILMPTLISLFEGIFQVMYSQIDDVLHALGGGSH